MPGLDGVSVGPRLGRAGRAGGDLRHRLRPLRHPGFRPARPWTICSSRSTGARVAEALGRARGPDPGARRRAADRRAAGHRPGPASAKGGARGRADAATPSRPSCGSRAGAGPSGCWCATSTGSRPSATMSACTWARAAIWSGISIRGLVERLDPRPSSASTGRRWSSATGWPQLAPRPGGGLTAVLSTGARPAGRTQITRRPCGGCFAGRRGEPGRRSRLRSWKSGEERGAEPTASERQGGCPERPRRSRPTGEALQAFALEGRIAAGACGRPLAEISR